MQAFFLRSRGRESSGEVGNGKDGDREDQQSDNEYNQESLFGGEKDV
jgi:hypothetical protein